MGPFLRALAKRKRFEEEDEFILHVSIRCAEGIDKDNMGPKGDSRTYRVFGSIRPDIEFSTPEAEGEPDPSWRVIYKMRLRELGIWRHLNLEVVRTGSRSDPGTSSGSVLVGRAQIPLPGEVGTSVWGRYGLVRPVGRGYSPEGHIIVVAEISKVDRVHRYYY
ncbi:hypothetical protein U1Q18_022295 [Sarracenia purpurea var. burkii]